MEQELISVVIPAYKAEKTLEAAVYSVLAQTWRMLEVLIVDDHSPDGTRRLMERLAAEDERIRLFFNESNRGVSYNRNLGVREGRGKWVAFLDSDDLWAPDKLEKQMAVTAEYPDTDMVYTAYGYINADGSPRRYVFSVPPETDERKMLKKNVMSTSGVLLRRELVLAHPFADNVAHEDLHEWLTLLRSGGKARGVQEALHTIRLSGQESRSGNKKKAAGNRMKLYEQMGISRGKALYYWACYAGNAGVKYLALRLMK